MRSRLHISSCLMQKKTILKDSYCEAPYRIMMPFYEGSRMEIVTMSASAGIFGGDYFTSDFDIGDNTKIRIKSQSYEKVFQRKEQTAKKVTRLQIGQKALCAYLPYPVIPFAKSRFEADTEIHLCSNSMLFYGDIFNCGRVGMQEQFKMDWFRNRTNIYVDNKLAFVDNTYINPAKWDYSKMGFWHGYTHNGMLYIYFPEEGQEDQFLEWFRQWSKEDETQREKANMSPLYWGSTKCLKGIGIRVIGMEGESIYQAFEEILKWIYNECGLCSLK